MGSHIDSVSTLEARLDPRSRHHPQHQIKLKVGADDNTGGHGVVQGQGIKLAQHPPPVIQHHPSHPEHRSYIRHPQLQQNANGAGQDLRNLLVSPTSPHAQQRQYLLSPTNRHPHFRRQEVRRVASVERGLGQNKPPASHRMSRMKSFGDRDRERHRADDIGPPFRRDQLHQPVTTSRPSTPRGFEVKDMNGNTHGVMHPKRVDPLDRPAQVFPGGSPRTALSTDDSPRKAGLPSTPSPNSSRPGSSWSRRESGSGLKDSHAVAEQEMERAASRSGNHKRPPLLVKMPLAFNSISRERGFSASSQPPLSPRLPSPRPSNSAPDLAKTEKSVRSHHGYGPDAYYAQRRHDHYNMSQPSSAHHSPHTSILPDSRPTIDRDSTISSSATSSNAMTVDEAIGMYGSDTDQEDEDTAAVEEQVSRFHSENLRNEEINGPVSSFPLQVPHLRDTRSPPPPSSSGSYSREPKSPLSSPSRVSEVLADDVVLPPVEETGVKDDSNDSSDHANNPLPPQQDPPPTPPQSPPAVHIPLNPLENCMQPCKMPEYISKEVPPRLPYIGNGHGDPVKDVRDRYGYVGPF